MNNFVVLRFEKVKSRSELVGRSMHNLRKGNVPDHVDSSKVKMNQVMGNAVKRFDQLTAGIRMRKNGVIAVEALLSFSAEMAIKIDAVEWSAKSLEWMAKEFGEENLLEISLHLDEKTPHLHVLFVPRNEKKKWNWRGICPGRAGMRNLQSRYGDAMKPFGLRRGEPKIGRDHVPPAVQRELEKTRADAKLQVMDRERSILALVKEYFGENQFLQFLQWVKDRAKKAKRTKTLEKELQDPKTPAMF